MLSTHEMRAHVGRLAYRPGWRFSIYEGAWEGPHCQITTVVQDPRTGENVTLDVHSPIPPMSGLDDFERWLCWRLCRIETHEAREFLRRDGRPIFDPHAEFADRDVA